MCAAAQTVKPKMVVHLLIGNMSMKHKPLGFSYIGLLIAIAIAGIGLAAAGTVWHQTMQRAREIELLYLGDTYRQAIASYYQSNPTGVKTYPKTLSELLVDKRFPTIKRHIRTLYPNPINPKKPWSLVVQQGQILGVYVDSDTEPIKKTGFPEIYQSFEKAERYSDWQFIYKPN